MTIAMALFSYAEITYVISSQREFLKGGDTFLRLRSLAADAEVEASWIGVLVEAYHLPLLAVERVVAGDGVGIAGNLVIDELDIVEDFVVVVIGGANGSHGDHAVIAALVLLEAELLVERIVGINKECGGVIKAVGREARLHLGQKREWLGVIDFGHQHSGIVLRQFAVVRIDEVVSVRLGAESDDASRVRHLFVGSVQCLGEVNVAKCQVAVGQFLVDCFRIQLSSAVLCAA